MSTKPVFIDLLKTKLQKVRFVFESLAVESGIQKGRQDYQKFIILTRSRSGSNLLCSLLNSSAQISVSGELFQNRRDIIQWMHWVPPHCRSQVAKDLRETSPTEFLNKIVFRKFPQRIKAVGFKIFYYHAHEGNESEVWDYLRDIPNLKIIHLKRRNLLKVHLSKALAERDKVYVKSKNKKFNSSSVTTEKSQFKPIYLDFNDCLEDFQTTQKSQKQYEEFFSRKEILEIIYEDFLKDYATQIERIQGFLGASPELLIASTEKQGKQPLSSSIENFYDLKEQFSNTPWSTYFE